MDTLGVAIVGSSEDSFASALPDLVVAIFELRTVAIGNEIPVGVLTVDGGDNLFLGLADIGALFSHSIDFNLKKEIHCRRWSKLCPF